jgi:hypothetical protein
MDLTFSEKAIETFAKHIKNNGLKALKNNQK